MIRRILRRSVTLHFMVAVSALFATAPGAARADAKIYKKVLPSTAWIVTKTAEGSGVLVDVQKRLVVTNEHVVDGQSTVAVFFPQFKDGRHIAEPKHYLSHAESLGVRGRVLLTDTSRDIALIQIDRVPEGAVAVTLAASSASPGDTVHSIGNAGSSDARWIYTSGSVRAVYHKRFNSGKPRDLQVVETQSPINPGDSGGPVVNAEGELVGISQSIHTQARLVSHCVDVSEIRGLLAEEAASTSLNLGELLASAGLKISQETPKAFAIEFKPEGGEKRTIYVAKATERFGGSLTRRVFGVARASTEPLTLELAKKLLEQNARTKLGSWAVETNSNGQTLVIFSAPVDASSGEKLAAAVEYAAKMAASLK
jgi:serine protease Do